MVQQVVLVPHGSGVLGLILSSGYCQCGILHVLSMFMGSWVSTRFSGFPPPSKDM